MIATQVAQIPPTRARPLTYDLHVEGRTLPESEGAVNAREDDALLWQLDEDGWD
jgi:hypothetical protein